MGQHRTSDSIEDERDLRGLLEYKPPGAEGLLQGRLLDHDGTGRGLQRAGKTVCGPLIIPRLHGARSLNGGGVCRQLPCQTKAHPPQNPIPADCDGQDDERCRSGDRASPGRRGTTTSPKPILGMRVCSSAASKALPQRRSRTGEGPDVDRTTWGWENPTGWSTVAQVGTGFGLDPDGDTPAGVATAPGPGAGFKPGEARERGGPYGGGRAVVPGGDDRCPNFFFFFFFFYILFKFLRAKLGAPSPSLIRGRFAASAYRLPRSTAQEGRIIGFKRALDGQRSDRGTEAKLRWVRSATTPLRTLKAKPAPPPPHPGDALPWTGGGRLEFPSIRLP